MKALITEKFVSLATLAATNNNDRFDQSLLDLPIPDLFTDLDLINVLNNDCVPVVKNQEINLA